MTVKSIAGGTNADRVEGVRADAGYTARHRPDLPRDRSPSAAAGEAFAGAARRDRAELDRILAGVGHTVCGRTKLRAMSLLEAARAAAKEHPRGFPDERQFAQEVADLAFRRFSLGVPLKGPAVRASKTYWAAIKVHYKSCETEKTDSPHEDRWELPSVREALDMLKPHSFAYPNMPTTDIFRRAFGKRNVPLSDVSQHIGRLCEEEGKYAGELRALIERHMKSRSSIAWRRIKDLRAEFSAACRGVIHAAQTQSIVGQMRGGADEMRFLIDIVHAGYKWSAQRILFHGMNRDYLVLYRLKPIREGGEFCVLYADTRLDYSTVEPRIPNERTRRRDIAALAGDGRAFPNTRFVVFAGEGWDKRTAIEANIPAVGRGQRDIKELVSAIERARQAVEKLQANVFASLHLGSDLTNLDLTLHLAMQAEGAQRDRRIIEGISAAEGLIAKVRARTGGGGSSGGGASRLAPASRSLVFGGGFSSGIAGGWAFAYPPVIPCPCAVSAFHFIGSRLF